MPKRCALGCPQRGVPSHLFPNPEKFPKAFKAWVELIGGKLNTATDYEFYRKKIICDIHFTPNDKNRNNRLNCLAVPSLFLPRTSLHRFPNPDKFPEQFKAWVNIEGGKLQSPKDYLQYINKRICNIHFREQDRNRNNRLNALAVPSLHLPNLRRSVDEERFTTMNSSDDSNDYISDGNNVDCTDVEYLEEETVYDDADDSNKIAKEEEHPYRQQEETVYDDADDSNEIAKEEEHPYLKQEETPAPKKQIFEKEITLSLDDVDYLFLSYAQTFRTLAKQFQTMLKLDIAKIFARYEMKNTSFSTQVPAASNPPTPVKPQPLAVKPPPRAVNPLPQTVKPLLQVVKPLSQSVKLLQPVGKTSLDRRSVIIPSKEDNKKIFKRVPLEAVISGMYKPAPIQSSPKIQNFTKNPSLTHTPYEIKRSTREVKVQKTQLPKTQSNVVLEMVSKRKSILLPKKFNPTVKLERITTNLPIQSSAPSESIPPPPPKKIKYYVPKKGPAYAILSKEELEKRKVELDKSIEEFEKNEEGTQPDLEMEVSEHVHTETVFVTTDHANFSEDET